MTPGKTFPIQKVSRVGGGALEMGRPQDGYDWQMVVIYRGLHCPICKKYLAELDRMQTEFHDLGIDVVAISGDPHEKALAMVEENQLSIPLGYDLSVAQMRTLGLYVSDPRSAKETDRPFPEPGLFVINGEGNLQIVDISNAPFARPDLSGVLGGLKFILDNSYPVRGTHAAG